MPALIQWWTQDLLAIAPDAFPDAVQAAGADLLTRWREPHRRYHDTHHLVEIFWALEELEDAQQVGTRQATVGRLAGWFHDAIYDPTAGAGANEADSAQLAHGILRDLDVAGADGDDIERLVLMTAGHDAGDGRDDPLEAAFHDADLWILSADHERFDAYCALIREEYAAIPDAAYRLGRAQILRGLADREHVYRTDYARSEWEPQARNNLDRELDRLAAPALDPA